MEDRNFIQYAIITLKGMAMGAADVVPGVSGGTIAFISGIYEELITSINNVDISLFKTLRKDGLSAFWKKLNGNFLVALFLGIAISVFSLAKFISWLLVTQPILVWSFFFGLVVASVFFVGKSIEAWTWKTVGMFILGTALAYFVTILPPSQSVETLPFLFFCGALAICAMILPGISGAFILVLLGSYKTILDSVHERDLKIIQSVAFRQAEEIMGKADAKATAIYAGAYNQTSASRNLYSFLKSMETFEHTFDTATTVVLSTKSELYKYLINLE